MRNGNRGGQAPATAPPPGDRQAIRAELDRRSSGQRLTPAQRRIAQCLIENSAQIGFLSSTELAEIANVSQPSVTRFAMALGFEGYLDMRRYLRFGGGEPAPVADTVGNRYQAAAVVEAENLSELAKSLADEALVDRFGAALAASRPLAVMGLRASAGLATQFCYFAAKVHSDVRLITSGGSFAEDLLEQAQAAGGRTLLTFLMPLYPRESLRAIEFARQLGLTAALVTDVGFTAHHAAADLVLPARINTSLVFDSYAASSVLITVLLDAMCGHMNGEARKRLELGDRSSKKRKVFAA